MRSFLRDNEQRHHSENQPRFAAWLANLPADHVGDMCAWVQFCRFAHEAERRTNFGEKVT
ncbi:hypothetical protein RCH09_003893 [Actimicrobium sp. GrIS 1.19]|uniref:hypothetical protein n=1 Tax=Actimicrobium sp. GrIS 1.19 TaxID=3071708 RepID=UPI002DFB98D1|nr:hypothetical protein [Actimicrobium sp. GrIS 1.19]